MIAEMDEGKGGAADYGRDLLRLLDLIEIEEPASVRRDGAGKGGGGPERPGYGFEHVDEGGVRRVGAARREDQEVQGFACGEHMGLKPGEEGLFVNAKGFGGMEMAAGLVRGGAAGVERGGAVGSGEDGEIELFESGGDDRGDVGDGGE